MEDIHKISKSFNYKKVPITGSPKCGFVCLNCGRTFVEFPELMQHDCCNFDYTAE